MLTVMRIYWIICWSTWELRSAVIIWHNSDKNQEINNKDLWRTGLISLPGSYGAVEIAKISLLGNSQAVLTCTQQRAGVLETLSAFCRSIGLDMERNLCKALVNNARAWRKVEQCGRWIQVKFENILFIQQKEIGDITRFQGFYNLRDLWAHAIKTGQKG